MIEANIKDTFSPTACVPTYDISEDYISKYSDHFNVK